MQTPQLFIGQVLGLDKITEFVVANIDAAHLQSIALELELRYSNSWFANVSACCILSFRCSTEIYTPSDFSWILVTSYLSANPRAFLSSGKANLNISIACFRIIFYKLNYFFSIFFINILINHNLKKRPPYLNIIILCTQYLVLKIYR